MSDIKQSLMMEQLYGSKVARIVYQRCQELGHDFNERVQRYVYDTIWAKLGLKLREKSLITIVSLIATNKAEQLKIHLWGFFNLEGTPSDVLRLLNYMKQQEYISDVDEVVVILKLAETEYTDITTNPLSSEITLNLNNGNREKNIVDFSAHIALGNNERTRICVKELLKNTEVTITEMHHIMQHQAVYCGFPVEMNGRAVLKEIDL